MEPTPNLPLRISEFVVFAVPSRTGLAAPPVTESATLGDIISTSTTIKTMDVVEVTGRLELSGT
jgi:hypothetical protein